MKLLLLTDVPPCTNYTAGLVLNQLCQFVPQGGLACFVAMNGGLQPEWDPKLDWMPRRVVFKPGEFGLSPPRRRRLMRAAGMVREYGRRALKVPPLIDQATAFGREQKVDAVWAVLQGQTMVRMARRVARRLRVPLYTQVWDPLEWWLRAHIVDPLNRRAALAEFDATLRASVACAAASQPMADRYATRYGVRSVPVIAGLDAALARLPASAPRLRDEVTIGMAGQFYAGDEWLRLIEALNLAGWRVAGREVKLKVFGRDPPPGEIPPDRVTFTGFIPQPDLVRALADETDIAYCPYPFDPRMSDVARLSFPSKLPVYFASGRPVLFQGPDYSAPYKYITARGAGVCARGSEPAAIFNALEQLVGDAALYERTAFAGSEAFRADFTLDRMQRSFFDFLGVPGAEAFTDPTFSIPNAARASKRPAGRSVASTGDGEGNAMTELEDMRALVASLQRDLAQAKAAEQAVWQEVAGLKAQHAAERAEWERQLILIQGTPEDLDETTRAYVLSANLKRMQETNTRLQDQLLRLQSRALPDTPLFIELKRLEDANGNLIQELTKVRSSIAPEGLRLQVDALKEEVARLRTENAVAAVRLSMQEEITELKVRADAPLAHFELERAIKRAGDAEQAVVDVNDALTTQQQAHASEVRSGIEYLSAQLAESREVKAAEGRLVGRLAMLSSDLAEMKREFMRPGDGDTRQATRLRTLYLDLLEAAVCGRTSSDPNMDRWSKQSFDPDRRLLGRDWPRSAQTMIGQVRLRNIRTLVERVIEERVPGDLLEAGVWRGGACIYMRGILQAYGERARKVWVADSFQGLPPPDAELYPKDAGDEHHVYEELQASANDVRQNFAAYGLLDEQVRFLEGWFKDTLPEAPVKQLAVLRLDGDMYGSTMETLDAMYHRVSPGGFIIVDDYILKPCREAIEDFRKMHDISDSIEEVDGAAVYWRKGSMTEKQAAAE